VSERSERALRKTSIRPRAIKLTITFVLLTRPPPASLKMLFVASLGAVVLHAPKVMSAERASLFIFDEQKDELWSISASHNETKDVFRVSTDGSIVGHVAKTGELLNINDAYGDRRFNRKVSELRAKRASNTLTARQ